MDRTKDADKLIYGKFINPKFWAEALWNSNRCIDPLSFNILTIDAIGNFYAYGAPKLSYPAKIPIMIIRKRLGFHYA